MPKEKSLETIIKVAEKAKDYARAQILKGGTQLENNALTQADFYALHNSVKNDIRPYVAEQPDNPLEKNKMLARYEKLIAVTSKYSLGNCHELAVQALDYVLNKTDISAELIKIRGGDHTFIVLNREPQSNIRNPASWGPNAVICDPWSNKVYPAKYYLTELKNFYRENNKNHIEDFNPLIHAFAKGFWSTASLNKVRNVTMLKFNLIAEVNVTFAALEKYKKKLEMTKSRLENKYGKNEQAVLIVKNKIDLIDSYLRGFKEKIIFLQTKDYRNDYRTAKTELTNELKNISSAAISAMQFGNEEAEVLFAHRDENKTKVGAMRLFGIKNKTESEFEEIEKEVNQIFINKK